MVSAGCEKGEARLVLSSKEDYQIESDIEDPKITIALFVHVLYK